MHIEPVSRLNLPDLETVVFAGGGNRCWWQAASVMHWLDRGWHLPANLVGTSGGAAIAAASLSQDGLQRAFEACRRLFDGTPRLLERGGAERRWRFAHQRVYPAWLASFVNDETFEAVRGAPQRLRVALTRPARALGLKGSIVAGTLGYLIDKWVWNRLHPGLPRLFGMRQDFVELQQCANLAEAQTLLVAAAAAPPFLRSQQVGDGLAIDGGYLDSVPLPEQDEGACAATLVLLTRHYPKLPRLFRHRGRHYLQASRRIPVSTWDCTARATIQDAFDLGTHDAADALAQGLLTLER
jgi:predicted acylesterase/phospholipase RssA